MAGAENKVAGTVNKATGTVNKAAGTVARSTEKKLSLPRRSPLGPTRQKMDALLDTLTRLLVDWGYWGLLLSAFVAGSILPFSSEAVLILLVRMGLDPVWCLAAAAVGNTLGGMSCYWIGTLGRSEWIERLGVSEKQLAKARKILSGRGALMGFFGFLPYVGEAIAIVLGLMHANRWLTAGSMFVGKLLRYIVILATFQGAASLF